MMIGSNSKEKLRENTPSLAGLLFLIQLLLLTLIFNPGLNLIFLGIGWISLIPSFILLTFSAQSLQNKSISKIKGEIQSEEPVLIKAGLYQVIRHPMYFGWIMMSISLAFISQFWLSTLLTLIIIPLVLLCIHWEEIRNVDSFGAEYIEYKKEVPMMNVFTGVWRLARKKVGNR